MHTRAPSGRASRVTGRQSRRESVQQDEGLDERDVGWRAVGPRIQVRSTKVRIDAIRVGRTCAQGQLGQALDRGAVRLGQRNRLIVAGAIGGALRLPGVRIFPCRRRTAAETIPSRGTATRGGGVRRSIPRDRPSTGRRCLRAGECQDCEPALHPNISRHRATSFSWLIICALRLGQDQPVSVDAARHGCRIGSLTARSKQQSGLATRTFEGARISSLSERGSPYSWSQVDRRLGMRTNTH
jgi:hypothetical protein